MEATRRSVLSGVGAALASPAIATASGRSPPIAWSETPAFADSPLAANTAARRFVAPAGHAVWPEELELLGPGGPQSIAAWRGKTMLVALWAEWCAPCLAEMPALARLNRSYRNPRFEIAPIVTGSKTLHSVADAQSRLAALPGADIDTLLDASPDGGALMHALANSPPPPGFKAPPGATVISATLPCLLVVDPAGRLRGRALGGSGPGERNLWDMPGGEAFIKRLADGAVGGELAAPTRTTA
ncbi:TlpA disulfide reductase family protein [Phenylobacterium sp.]|uniref:TlpA disulfide reductase family protein n=1 Tax=Phenylobacterium sp. TaxID=1871053 RepID=UPI0012252ED6|nr:TlpA disulfide reductase family protein [Phenylobacterium sp.]THD54201.1 MAG: TlpA family protein disulfide reductase [Phenylobacterium sp.]